MTADQEAHLQRILVEFNSDARAKYQAGQSEHGGNLWEKPGMLDCALAEAVDLVIYLMTLRQQLRGGGTEGSTVRPVVGPVTLSNILTQKSRASAGK